MRLLRYLSFWIWILVSSVSLLWAEIDLLQVALSDPQAKQILWEQIDNSSSWYAGKKITGLFRDSSYFSLGAGEYSIVRVPANSLVRINVLPSTGSWPELSQSSGSGIYERLQEAAARNATGLSRIYDTRQAYAALLKVACPQLDGLVCKFKIFVSQPVFSKAILPYRTYVAAEGVPNARLADMVQSKSMSVAILLSGGRLKFKAIPSRRVLVEARYLYAEHDYQSERHVQLKAAYAGEPLSQHSLFLTPETRGPVLLNGRQAVISGVDRAFITLPRVGELLELQSSDALLIRVLALDEEDAHIPTAAVGQWQAWRKQSSFTLLDDLSRGLESAQAHLFVNSKQESALRGLHQLEHVLGSSVDWPQVQSELQTYRRFTTFAREVLPVIFSNKPLQQHSFIVRHLNELGRQQGDLHLAEQHLLDYSRFVMQGTFVSINKGAPDALEYELPERWSDSSLRLAVLRSSPLGVALSAKIYIQFDEQAPRVLEYDPKLAAKADDLAPSVGLVAWQALHNSRDSRLSARFRQLPSMAEVDTIELKLPAAVQRVRVWSQKEAELAVNLAYRTSKQFRLGLGELQSVRASVALSLLDDMIKEIVQGGYSAPKGADLRLFEALYPLAHEIASAYLALRPSARMQFGSGSVAPCDAQLDAARQLQMVDPPIALRYWQKALSVCSADKLTFAMQQRTQMLIQQGELFLARNLLVHDLYYETAERSASAWRELLELNHTDRNSAIDVASVGVFLLNDKKPALEALYKLLIDTGRFEDAAIIMMLLDSDDAITPAANESLGQFDLSSDPKFQVTSAAGSVFLYSKARNLFSRYWRATAKAPFNAKIFGPGFLELEYRKLIDASAISSASDKNDWIKVQINSSKQHFPLVYRQVSSSLLPIDSQKSASWASRTTLELNEGPNDISVYPEQGSILVRADELFEADVEGEGMQSQKKPLASERHYGVIANELYRVELAGRSSLEALVTLASGPIIDERSLSLLRRLQGSTKWRRVEHVSSSGGVRKIAVDGQSSGSPSARLRSSLLPALKSNERRISAGEEVVLELSGSMQTELSLRAQLSDLGGSESPKNELVVQIGAREAKFYALKLGEAASFKLDLEGDEQYLKLRLKHQYANHYLTVSVNGSNQGSKWLARGNQVFHVATSKQPIVLDVQGPTVLRIDRHANGLVESREQVVQSGSTQLALFPKEGKDEDLYRIYERVSKDRDIVMIVPPKDNEAFVPSIPKVSPALVNDVREIDPKFIESDLRPGDRSWSMRAGLRQRRIFDDSSTLQLERFGELGASVSGESEQSPIFRTSDFSWRSRQEGGSSILLAHDLVYSPEYSSLSWSVGGYLGGQEQSLIAGHKDLWIFSVDAAVRHRQQLGEQYINYLGARLFGRALEAPGDLMADLSKVDQDIYSPYKETHQTGIEISDSLTYQPELDTSFLARARVRSNSVDQSFVPDQLGLTLAALRSWSGVALGAGYQFTHFIEDEDRSSASTRHAALLELELSTWLGAPDELAVVADGRFDFDNGELSAGICLRWDFNQLRFTRDHSLVGRRHPSVSQFHVEQAFLESLS